MHHLLKEVLNQLILIRIMSVKGDAAQICLVAKLGNRDLIKRLLLQKLNESGSDVFLGSYNSCIGQSGLRSAARRGRLVYLF